MKFTASLVGTFLLISGMASSTENQFDLDQQDINKSKIQVSPDVSYWKATTRYVDANKETNVSGTASLYGIQIGYDYVAPRSIYSGTDLHFAEGKGSYNFSASSIQNNDLPPTEWKEHEKVIFVNFEQRVGYTFQQKPSSKTAITAFAGLGANAISPDHNSKALFSTWHYSSIGVWIRQCLHPSLFLNLRAKLFYTFDELREAKNKHGYIKATNKKGWGYELALPVSWQFSTTKQWSLELHPYLTIFNIKSSDQMMGFRLNFSHWF